MNIFAMLFSFIGTMIITYFNKDIFFTINFALIILLYISMLMFFKSFMSYFSFESLDKTTLVLNNKKLMKKINEIIKKNHEVINMYNSLRTEYIILTLKNAHLALLSSSLTNNKNAFEKTIKELESIGITTKSIEKFGNLLNLINLIETKKVEIVITESKSGNKISFNKISS